MRELPTNTGSEQKKVARSLVLAGATNGIEWLTNGHFCCVFFAISAKRMCTTEKNEPRLLSKCQKLALLNFPHFPTVFKCLYNDVAFFQWFLSQCSVVNFSKIRIFQKHVNYVLFQ